jgi:alanyl-tRNA synthetase
MNTGQLRQTFLEYFQHKEHTWVSSSSLVPQNDPTLLFTNAGMVQFKDTFLGQEKRPYTKAVSCQACLRAGGKHNDLENVGYTARHHTFFEMLGNFSFGDYFKKEAIHFAWEFLTQVLKLPAQKLWVTVYEEDQEAEDIWLNDLKIDPTRFSRCGAKDNFWSMGDTGPCGPCTEIFYDHGPDIPGGPPGSAEEDGDRYIEIWNLVFMQFNRDTSGALIPLPKPSVDTGMGFERIAAVMQGVHSNYDIDIFKALIQAVASILNVQDLCSKSLRVIVDHIRACSFLIMDGVLPSNEGRGYVLRRICRRAIRHGQLLGSGEKPFFYRLVKTLAAEMGEAYPALVGAVEQIEQVIEQEEIQFAKTLTKGLKILEQDLADLSGKIISGETVFKLYDTYGFPVDLTADIARERGLTLDMEGFNQAMAAQRTRARSASQFSGHPTEQLAVQLEALTPTIFLGYETLKQEAVIKGLYHEGQPIDECQPGILSTVVLDQTPFYAEAGGQVGDQGVMHVTDGVFEVLDTKRVGSVYIHQGVLQSGLLKVGDAVLAEVDAQKRGATARNHSATHLLHAALRQVVGEHVQQKGSLVESQRLRFDYTHTEALSIEQLRAVERVVNEQIRLNSAVKTDLMLADEAIQHGAMALFGEKYDKTKPLRVLTMGDKFSIELCGGTHVKRTGDIGFLKILSETGISAGVRRLEAVTGAGAMAWVETLENTLLEVANILKTSKELVLEQVEKNLHRTRKLEKELQQLKTTLASGNSDFDLTQKIKEIKGVKVLAILLPITDPKTLKVTMDNLKTKLKSAVLVLARIDQQKVSLVAGVTDDCTDRIRANDLIHAIAPEVGGRGGGRAELAQAGGDNPEGLERALALAYQWVEERL